VILSFYVSINNKISPKNVQRKERLLKTNAFQVGSNILNSEELGIKEAGNKKRNKKEVAIVLHQSSQERIRFIS